MDILDFMYNKHFCTFYDKKIPNLTKHDANLPNSVGINQYYSKNGNKKLQTRQKYAAQFKKKIQVCIENYFHFQ